jgi:hypothetical protein
MQNYILEKKPESLLTAWRNPSERVASSDCEDNSTQQLILRMKSKDWLMFRKNTLIHFALHNPLASCSKLINCVGRNGRRPVPKATLPDPIHYIPTVAIVSRRVTLGINRWYAMNEERTGRAYYKWKISNVSV